MSLALAFAALLAQDQDQAVTMAEGGFCSSLAWVSAPGADGYTIDRGPDFAVYRYSGPDGEWGIYDGGYSQVSNGTRKRLFARDGVTVDAMTVDGQFRGYLAEDSTGRQNHFFGTPFKGDASDLAFFERVDFGAVGKAKCARHPPKW